MKLEKRLNFVGFAISAKSVVELKSMVELIVCVRKPNPLGQTTQGKDLSFCIFIPELELMGSSLEGCLGEGVP